MPSNGITYDTSDLIPLMRALGGVEAELRQNANKRLRQAAGECARGLIPALAASAASSPTPQARLVASTAKVSSDRVPVLKVGGSRRVGRNKTPAGVLAWGSERGGANFAAAPGGSYWIAPAVAAYQAGPALGVYRAAVAGILADAGVLLAVAGIGNITIKIGAETADAVRGIGQVNQALGDQMTKGQKASSALKKAAAPAALAFGAASTAIISFTKAAAEDADAQASLERSLKATTGATDAQVKASEDYITKLSRATGVTDDEMRPALEKLAAATGSTKKGQEQLARAVDIAAASHTDLATASAAVVKADQGRLGALNKLVPGIDAATIKSKDGAKALDEASKLTSGAATDAAKTYGGQMKVMSNQIGEAEESIGAAFLPVLKDLMPILQKVTDLISGNTTAFSFLLGAVAGVSGVIIAANIAIKAYKVVAEAAKVATALWEGAQWLLNAALDANPIGLIVLAIVGAAGLVIAIKLAYDHCKTFHDAIDKLWDIIKTGIKLYLTPWKEALDLIKTAFDAVKTAIEGPIGTAAIAGVKTVLDTLLDPLRTIARLFKRIAEFTFDALVESIKTLIGWIEKIHIPKVPDWVPGIGGKLAPSGFAVAGPSARLGLAPVAAGSSASLTINVFGAVDAEGTARQIQRLLQAHDRRRGKIA